MDLYNPDAVDCDYRDGCNNKFKNMAGNTIELNNFPTEWQIEKDAGKDSEPYISVKDGKFNSEKSSEDGYPVCEMTPACVEEYSKS